MPDRLDVLRDAVQDVVEPLALERRAPFRSLVERAGRRRRRRWQVGAAVLVALVGAGVLLNKPVTDRVNRGTPPATLSYPAPLHSNQQLVQSLVFATPETGYAVVIVCRGPVYQCSHHAMTLRTTDGGRSWTRLPNPAENGPGESVRIWEATPLGVVVASDDTAYYSTDLRTWHPRPTDPVTDNTAVEWVPEGWRLGTAGGVFVALDPITYRFHRLAHQPDLPASANVWTTRSGPSGVLLAGVTPQGQGLQLRYSTDRGRTWRAQQVPSRPDAEMASLLTDDGTDRIYVSYGDNNARAIGIARLDHLGGTWTPVPVPKAVGDEPNPGTVKVIHLLPDGELYFDMNDAPLRSLDGGTRTVASPTIRLYGTTTTVSALQSLDGTLFSTLPPGVEQPDDVVPILISTDAGQHWTLRDPRLK
jgi:hypothetical protein